MGTEEDPGVRYCWSCGQELSPQARYCDQCGAKQDEGVRETTADTAATANQVTDDAQPAGQASASRTAFSTYTGGQRVVLIGAALAVIGAFLPWFSISVLGSTVSVNGIDRDGIFSLLFGLAIIAVVLYQGSSGWSRRSLVGCALLGLLVTLLGVAYIVDPTIGMERQITAEEEELINIGVGLYLTAIGGLVTLAGVFVDLRKS